MRTNIVEIIIDGELLSRISCGGSPESLARWLAEFLRDPFREADLLHGLATSGREPQQNAADDSRFLFRLFVDHDEIKVFDGVDEVFGGTHKEFDEYLSVSAIGVET